MAWIMAKEQLCQHQKTIPKIRQTASLFHARFAVGFLPKCLAWYLPRIPVGLTSGAEPRGSFS